MAFLLAEWKGKAVQLTLRATMPTLIHGTLVAVDEVGVMLELADGNTFVPFTSLLHVSLSKTAS